MILFCGLAVLGVKRLGYVEFSAARKLLSQRLFLRSLQEQIYLDSLSDSLRLAATHDAFWQIVYSTCEDLRFASVEMELDGQSYAGLLEITEQEPSWVMTLTFGNRGHLRLTRVGESASPSLMMLALHAFQQVFLARQNLVLAASAAQATGYAEDSQQAAIRGAA